MKPRYFFQLATSTHLLLCLSGYNTVDREVLEVAVSELVLAYALDGSFVTSRVLIVSDVLERPDVGVEEAVALHQLPEFRGEEVVQSPSMNTLISYTILVDFIKI